MVLYGVLCIFLVCNVISATPTAEYGANCPKYENINFIVVGSGATGGVVAGRLSEVEDFQVLLLEAGGTPTPEMDIPYDYPYRSNKGSKFYYLTEPQKSCCRIMNDGKSSFFQGKILGGGTSINAMVATIGNRKVYDEWEKLGNKGWGYKNVQQYFMKLMDYQVPSTVADAPYYATGGPVTISWPSFSTPLAMAYLEAGREIGHHFTDVNGVNQTGFGFRAMFIKDGVRMGTYNAYIKPAMKRKNFHVQTDSYVTKILFNGTQAFGVEYIYNNETCAAYMDKEVIISAGAIKSPQILMLSGIGPKVVLDTWKIPIVKQLDGVGQNFKDQTDYVRFLVKMDYPASMFVANYDSDDNRNLYKENLRGPLTFNKMEDISFIESSLATEGIPDLELTLEYNGFRFNNFPGLNTSYSDDTQKLADKNLVFFRICLLRPRSTGSVTLSSANPMDPPKIDPKYLDNYDDVKIMVEGMDVATKLVNTKALKKYGAEAVDFGKLPDCDQFTKSSARYKECVLRLYSGSDLHFMGSCKMGKASDKMAVVDYNLKVIGVRGVRVADASIFPTMVNAHTSIPCMMIGEKAADIIKKTYTDKKGFMKKN